ncbi:MAG: NAD-dependent epimerase/dehydratase family protein [Pelagibacteraceae bacterium TMED124]|nr:hypothetical protein [Rickettsiales bacterium]RPG16517.1 MAG: NAD-dependent epimerase/dehydratase family protein [Pelagibacteraceae bacterium TMED124]|tara:strand:- start:6422 stop:7192 length:771 start_codon:yes stop_codon:yes gene_type:complete
MTLESFKILTTGTKRGFGKFIAKKLNTHKFDRNSKLNGLDKNYDVIIHCANNSSKNILSKNFYKFSYDNYFLTEDLLKLNVKHFIFISSIGIYPQSNKVFNEKSNFEVKTRNFYEFFKIMNENYIKKNSKKFTILRVAGLLDKSSRKNSIQRIVYNENKKISLSSNSTLNYILYEDLLNFIKIVIKKKKFGIFNVSASKNIKLINLRNYLKSDNIRFGDYDYITPKIDNTKAKKEYAELNSTSYQNIKKYLKMIKK